MHCAECCIYLVFNVGLLGFVQVNLEQSGTIQTDSDPFTNYFSRINKIIQNSVVDSLESS